jgi:hypothetical protein
MSASFAQSVYHPQYIAADILFYFLFFVPISLLSLNSAQYFAKALTMTSSIPPPKPIALVPELEVADFDRSIHFYVEVLGFIIQYDRPERPFAYLALGDAHIMIEKGGGWMTGHLERPYGRGINFQIRIPEVKSVSGPGWLPLALLAGPGRSLSRGGKQATWSTSMAEASDLSWYWLGPML